MYFKAKLKIIANRAVKIVTLSVVTRPAGLQPSLLAHCKQDVKFIE